MVEEQQQPRLPPTHHPLDAARCLTLAQVHDGNSTRNSGTEVGDNGGDAREATASEPQAGGFVQHHRSNAGVRVRVPAVCGWV